MRAVSLCVGTAGFGRRVVRRRHRPDGCAPTPPPYCCPCPCPCCTPPPSLPLPHRQTPLPAVPSAVHRAVASSSAPPSPAPLSARACSLPPTCPRTWRPPTWMSVRVMDEREGLHPHAHLHSHPHPHSHPHAHPRPLATLNEECTVGTRVGATVGRREGGGTSSESEQTISLNSQVQRDQRRATTRPRTATMGD